MDPGVQQHISKKNLAGTTIPVFDSYLCRGMSLVKRLYKI